MNVSFYLYFQFLALPQLQATRAVSGRSVPIIASIAAGAGAIIRGLVRNLWEVQEILVQKLMSRLLVLGYPPMRLVLRYISRIMLLDGLSNLISKILRHTEGKLIWIPGLPAMYDYESFPQKVGRPI